MRMNVRRRAYTLAIASALTGLCALVQAQTPKAFEVAAIRPLDRPYSRPGSSRVTPGRFEITGVSAKELIGRNFRHRTPAVVQNRRGSRLGGTGDL